MHQLLELLRGQYQGPPIDETGCSAMLALAEEEHILPWASSRMRLLQTALPPEITARLEQIERCAAVAAFYWSSELKSVLYALERSSLRAVPLKGPFLAERLYGGAALRTNRDLDLLVSKTDLPCAEAILAAAGFLPGSPDDYHRPWRRQTTTLELHHDVENPLAFNFHTESALQRAQPAAFQGVRCWQLAPEDELLFLCLHAARHRFERLSLVLDLQLAFEKLPAAANPWQSRPQVAGLGNLLVLGFAMARRLQPDLAATVEIPLSRRQRLHLEQLADRQWNRLCTQPSDPLEWRALHAFFLEMELPGRPRFSRRLRHLRILAARAIGPDVAFAARFGLYRPWQVRTLRPLRLLAGLFHS